MDNRIFEQINRINGLMGNKKIILEQSPILKAVRQKSLNFINDISYVVGRKLNSVDEIVKEDIPKLINSKNVAIQKIITDSWGLTENQFKNMTLDELFDSAASVGIPKGQVPKAIKNASRHLNAEPKGGFSKTSDITPTTKIKPKIEELKPSADDLGALLLQGMDENEATIKWFKDRLKKFNLPKIKEAEVDDFLQEVIAQIKTKVPQLRRLEAKEEKILKEFQSVPREVQRQILTIVQKELYKGGFTDDFINSFKFFNNPNLKLYGYGDIMKKTLGLNAALTISGLVADGLRGIYDYQKDLDFTGHFGIEWFPTFLTKLALNFAPGFNVVFNSILLLESIVHGFVDVYKSKNTGKKKETGGLDDLMQSQQSTGEQN